MRAKRARSRGTPKAVSGKHPTPPPEIKAEQTPPSAPIPSFSRSELAKLKATAERYIAVIGGRDATLVIQFLEKATRAEEWFKKRASSNPLEIPATCKTAEESLRWMKREEHDRISGRDAPPDVNPVLCRWIWGAIEHARAGEYFAPGGSYRALREAVADLIPRAGHGRRFISPLWNERDAVRIYMQSQQGMSDEDLAKVKEIEDDVRDGLTGWDSPVSSESLSVIRRLKSRGRKILGHKPVRNREPNLPR